MFEKEYERMKKIREEVWFEVWRDPDALQKAMRLWKGE